MIPDPFLCLDIRRANVDDLAFLDDLQGKHRDALGFLSREALGVYAERGDVLLALDNGEPCGYLLGKPASRAYARGVAPVYQAVVANDARRRTIGKALTQRFMRDLPGGSRVAQMWCAADLDANAFWRAMGRLPVAWRAGGHGRSHILWRLPRPGVDPLTIPVPQYTHGGMMRRAVPVHPLIDDGQLFADPTPIPGVVRSAMCG